MLSKALVCLLTVNFFWAHARAAAIAKNVQTSSDVQRSLDDLLRAFSNAQTQTVTTPTGTISQNVAEIPEVLKDQTTVSHLYEYLQKLNSMQNTQTQTNVDFRAALRNPRFLDFLTSFFSQLFSSFYSKPDVAVDEETSIQQTQLSVTENQAPTQVAVQQAEDEPQPPTPAGPSTPQILLNELSNSNTFESHQEVSHQEVPNQEVPHLDDRFGQGNDNSQVTVTVVETTGTHQQPPFAQGSSSEALLAQLEKRFNQGKPTVAVQPPKTQWTTSTGNKVYGSQATNAHQYGSQATNAHQYGVTKEEEKRMAQNARYQFASQVNDGISGNFLERAEIREGTKVYGKYSYDDGSQFRSVYYEADEDGYRVTKEEISPSRVHANVNGVAQVQTLSNGNLVNYQITRKDIQTPKANGHHH